MAEDSSPATKQDIALLMKEMGRLYDRVADVDRRLTDSEQRTKEYVDRRLAESEQRTQEYVDRRLHESEERTKDYFNFYAGKLHKDFLGAMEDEVQTVKDKQENHEVRITRLEHAIAA